MKSKINIAVIFFILFLVWIKIKKLSNSMQVFIVGVFVNLQLTTRRLCEVFTGSFASMRKFCKSAWCAKSAKRRAHQAVWAAESMWSEVAERISTTSEKVLAKNGLFCTQFQRKTEHEQKFFPFANIQKKVKGKIFCGYC